MSYLPNFEKIIAAADKESRIQESPIRNNFELEENEPQHDLNTVKGNQDALKELFGDLQEWPIFKTIEIDTENLKKLEGKTQPIQVIKLLLTLMGRKLADSIPKKDDLDF